MIEYGRNVYTKSAKQQVDCGHRIFFVVRSNLHFVQKTNFVQITPRKFLHIRYQFYGAVYKITFEDALSEHNKTCIGY